MRSLIQHLHGRQLADVVWYLPDCTALYVADVVTSVKHLRRDEWVGKRIALDQMPVGELALALVALDGLAESIVMLPSEESLELRERRLTEAGIDLVLGAGIFTPLRAEAVSTGAPGIADIQEQHDSRAMHQTAWMLPTSGTTGVPKLIHHTLVSLTRSMSDRVIGAKHLWGSLYSIRRFAGLQVFLQSWLAATPLLLNEDGAGLDELMQKLIERQCTALSGTPSMWKKMSMHPSFDLLNVQQITLGGEIVDQAVLDMLARRKPQARVIHIYASTEAGVGFVVRDGRAGFPKEYLETFQNGLVMRVDESMHLLFQKQRAGADSRETWIDSGDVVRMDEDRVYFVGRANGSINVGGNKVMPEEVESVIDELPGVAFVQVRARKSAMLGNLVEAAIVPVAGTVLDADFKKTILAHCRSRLEPFKVPAFVVEAKDIALTASGKVIRGATN